MISIGNGTQEVYIIMSAVNLRAPPGGDGGKHNAGISPNALPHHLFPSPVGYTHAITPDYVRNAGPLGTLVTQTPTLSFTYSFTFLLSPF